MEKKEFVNYFELLGVSYEATNSEITAKVVSLTTKLNDAKSQAATEEERALIDSQIDLLASASKCLLNQKDREKHLEDIKKMEAIKAAIKEESVNSDDHDYSLAEGFSDSDDVEPLTEEEKEAFRNEKMEEKPIVVEILDETPSEEEVKTEENGLAVSSRAVNTRRTYTTSNNNEDVIDVEGFTTNKSKDNDTVIVDADSNERANRNEGNVRVTDVQDDEEAKEKSNKGKKIILGTVAGVLAAAIIIGATAYLIDYFSKKKNGNSDKNNSYSIVTEGAITGTVAIKDDDEPSATTTTEAETTTAPVYEDKIDNETLGGIVNRGDATDPKVIEERVNMINDYFIKSGIYNINTSQAYTPEEIRDILLFVNGAYVPSQEADVYSMVDNQMGFIAANISSFRNLDMVNYMANSDVITPEMIEADIKEYPSFDYVDAMLLGDSHCYPYLKWFNERYNAMVSTTDKEESRAIFAEMAQSLADLVEGDGYKIGDITYTIRDFENKGNVNEGNMLMMLVNMFSVYNTRYVKHDYVTSKRIVGEFSLTIDQVASQFDLNCADEIILLREDDVLPDDINKIQNNFHQRVQIDTVNTSLINGELQNQEFYKDQYTLSR